MKKKFNPIKHKYTLDGKKVPSVTQVLDFIFGKYTWKSIYGDIGEEIHNICGSLIMGKEVDFIDDRIPLGKIEAFKKWMKDKKIKPGYRIDLEKWDIKECDNKYFKFGFKIDLILHSRKWIIDIKSGSEQKKKDMMQLIAYLRGSGLLSYDMYNLYLNKNGDYEFEKRDYEPSIWEDFRSGLRLVKNYKR